MKASRRWFDNVAAGRGLTIILGGLKRGNEKRKRLINVHSRARLACRLSTRTKPVDVCALGHRARRHYAAPANSDDAVGAGLLGRARAMLQQQPLGWRRDVPGSPAVIQTLAARLDGVRGHRAQQGCRLGQR